MIVRERQTPTYDMTRKEPTNLFKSFWLSGLLMIGFVASACGCSKDNEPANPFEYSVALAPSGLAALAQMTQANFLVDGVERGRFTPAGGAHLTVPEDELLAERKLAVRLQGACQPVDVPLKPVEGVEQERRGRTSAMGRTFFLRVTFLSSELEPKHIYIDNLDGMADARVHVGNLELSVPAKQASRQLFVLGDCSTPPAVSAGDRHLGELPAVGDANHAVLVDLAGGHCYQWNEVLYKAKGMNPDQAASHPSPRQFTGGPLHEVPLAGFVLREPPPTLSGQSSIQIHSEIQRVQCRSVE